MTVEQIRRWLSGRFAEAVARQLARIGLTPNSLTLLGLAINAVAAYLAAVEQLLAAGLVVLFSGVFDLTDGALARISGRVTRFGAFLDSNVDRLSEIALFLGLLILYMRVNSVTEMILIFVALAGSLMVSYTKARAEGLGLRCDVGYFTRPERVIVLALGLIFNLVWLALWIVATLSAFTALHRIIYVWLETRKIDSSGGVGGATG